MRIAIYVRVSTIRQAQAQSIEQQIHRLQQYIEAKSWKLSADNIFRDDGCSGAMLNRPALDRLRDKVRMCEIDCVLITAPDRLARNFVHQILIMEEFKNNGCSIEFVDQPISNSPQDQLLLQIQGAVAEYERTLIADRMRRGRLAKYRAGLLLPWSSPPYGYRVNPDSPRDPSKITIEPTEAAIIEQIFNLYIQYKSTIYSVIKYLHSQSILSPKGHKRWSGATIKRILTNPAYIGNIYVNRTKICKPKKRHSSTKPIGKNVSQVRIDKDQWIKVATIPAIVGQQLFEQVSAKLAKNFQSSPRNNTKNQYLLRAMVSCGACKIACIGRCDNEKHSYYVCRANPATLTSPLDHRCTARYIPSSRLDNLVWEDLCKLITHPEIITQALERAWAGNWLPQELLSRKENLRKAMVSLTNQIERLTQAYLSAIINIEEFQRRRRELEEKQLILQQQLQQLQAQSQSKIELTVAVSSVEEFCKRVETGLQNANFDQKRLLIELLIDRVIVHNENVEIRYVFPTSKKGEETRFCNLYKQYFYQILPRMAFVIFVVINI